MLPLYTFLSVSSLHGCRKIDSLIYWCFIYLFFIRRTFFVSLLRFFWSSGRVGQVRQKKINQQLIRFFFHVDFQITAALCISLMELNHTIVIPTFKDNVISCSVMRSNLSHYCYATSRTKSYQNNTLVVFDIFVSNSTSH